MSLVRRESAPVRYRDPFSLARDLFGLPKTSYDNLTALLKTLRKPKLGEALSPSVLEEMMRDALPPLDALPADPTPRGGVTDPSMRFGVPGLPVSRAHPFYIGFMGATGVLVASFLLGLLGRLTSVLTLVVIALFLALALDPLVRADLQADLRQIFRALGKTVIIVTHDMGEAAFLGDTIVLLRDGAIVQRGTLPELYRRPVDPFVTRFINAQRSHLDALAEGA